MTPPRRHPVPRMRRRRSPRNSTASKTGCIRCGARRTRTAWSIHQARPRGAARGARSDLEDRPAGREHVAPRGQFAADRAAGRRDTDPGTGWAMRSSPPIPLSASRRGGTAWRAGAVCIAYVLFAAALASAQQPPSGRSFHDRYAELVANPRHMSDSARLAQLFRVNWEYVMTEFPEFATYVGYPGQNTRWTDNSLQAIERRKRELEEPLAVVKTIR